MDRYGSFGRSIHVNYFTPSATTANETVTYAFNQYHQETSVSTNQTFESYTYDNLGRVASVITTTLNGTSLGTAQTTSYAYDADGNLAHESLSSSQGTKYSYDSMNRLTTLTNTLGGTTLSS